MKMIHLREGKSPDPEVVARFAESESLKALARHVKEGVPLPDSLFRYQSDAYFDTFRKAKQLREAGALPELDWESEEMLGTDIGESVELKGVGRVWLDVPYLDESDEDINELRKLAGLPEAELPEGGPTAGMQNMFNELGVSDNTYITDGNKELTLDEVGPGFWLLGFDRGGSCFEMSKMSREEAKDNITGYGEYKVADADITDLNGARYYWNENMPDTGVLHIKKGVNEAEYQGKDVELNKPKRGGSKKYYVYVKNPKTGNVKKISFGDPGLKTKSGNKNRAKSFAARHNCEKKNDKTKAGYWACRLPRYGLVKGGKWW